MRRWITCLVLGLVLLPNLSTAVAQVSDPADLEGLERAVGRYYMGPVTTTESTVVTEHNEQGTPVVEYRTVSTPAAAPDPAEARGTVMLAVAVFEFDTDQHARTAFGAFQQDIQESIRRDPRLPQMQDVGLSGPGDSAIVLTGKQAQEDVTVDWVFAAVQDGVFLYAITGQFIGLNGEEQARSIVGALAEAEPGDGEFHEGGTSTGGLWAKLALVDPVLVEGSTVTDFVIYPPSGDSATGRADNPDVPRVDLANPASIVGLDSLHMRSYRVSGAGATPALSTSGVFLIDAWILTFESPERAADLMQPSLTTLSEGINVITGFASGGATAPSGPTTETVGNEGYLSDPSLPPGSGVAQITRVGATVYAAVVYSVETDSAPMAEALITQMIETPERDVPEVTGVDGTSTGGVWVRFPEAGDPVLEGLGSV